MRGLPLDLPPDCLAVRSAGGDWIARRECAAAIERGEADFILHGSGARLSAAGSGRGPLARLTLQGIPAVGKRALHGGLLGRFLGGLYLGRGRALDQLRAASRLSRAGVQTPEILAIGTRRAAGVFRAQAVVAREIAGARNLQHLAGERLSDARRRDILEKTAGLVRRMHDVGFLHADLNLANLVLGDGPAGESMWVVDLERGRFAVGLPVGRSIRMLARLLRSCEKWVAGPFRPTPREEVRFLRVYARRDRVLMRELVTRLSRSRRRLLVRRLSWRLLSFTRSTRPLE